MENQNQSQTLNRALLALEKMEARLKAAEYSKREPIAIIGLGCRFPGRATDAESFWQLLRDGMDLEKVKDLNDKLQYLEGEADKHMMTLYKDLFNGNHPPLQVIVVKDLYELLEKLIDRCRDAGNVISHIVLKNS